MFGEGSRRPLFLAPGASNFKSMAANNMIPRQPSIVWEVDLFLTALADAVSVQDIEPVWVALLID